MATSNPIGIFRPKTLFARMWQSLLLILIVTFLVNAVLVMKSLQLGAEKQTEKRLSRIGEYWSQQTLPAVPLGLDPVTVIYPEYAQLPDNLRQMLQAQERGIFELGTLKKDYFVLAQSRPSRGAFYVVEFHYQVKPSGSMEYEVFGWYLAGLGPFFLALLWLCKRVAANVSAPMREVGKQIATREPGSLEPLTLPAGSPTELNALVAQVNGAMARTAAVLDRERSFTQFASHELRTPAAVIKAAMERIESHATSEQAKSIDRANRGLVDLNTLIDTFLQLSRDSDSVHDSAWTDVNEAWIRSLFSHITAGTPDRELIVNSMESLVLEVPETMLHVLLVNMLKNALFHGGPGPIEVRIDRRSIEVSNSLPEHPSPGGYGIGTQLAHRICARFSLQFSLAIGQTAAVARVSHAD